MGFGFYGRSFSMTDPKCPDPGCIFSGAGAAGPCTDTEGILTYSGMLKSVKSSSKWLTESRTSREEFYAKYY